MNSLDILMDKEMDEDMRRAILKIIYENPDVKGVHDFRTRKSGLQNFAQFHIELDGSISFAKSHEIVEAVEDAITAELPELDVLIHADPDNIVENPKFVEPDRD